MISINIIKSAPDNRDYRFVSTVAPKANTDLRSHNRNIRDQAQEGSCVANTLANTLEIVTDIANQYEMLSAQFPYYTTRDSENGLTKEGIISLRDCLEAVRKYGICLESEWPYLAGNENTKPSSIAYDSAITRKVLRYEAVDISKSMAFGTDFQLGIDNIKSALAEGLPVMFALALGKKFYTLSGPLATQHYAPVDLPWDTPTGNDFIGSHAMTIVGNDDSLGGFIVENQWGTTWGDSGYCLIPYNVIKDFSEAWIIRKFKDINLVDPVLEAARQKVIKMYVATLGRAPELTGFKWWVNAVLNGGVVNTCLQDFLNSPESRARFTNDGQVVADIIYSLEKFYNRVAVAEYFVVDLACDRLDIAKIALNNVTEDPNTIEPAKLAIRAHLGQGIL